MPDDQHSDLLVDSGPLIIGVGASAGGLEAFQDLLGQLPNDHELAIVLVQHLDPNHDSLLSELLSKRTETPVSVAEDGVVVKGGHIYLIPPGQLLTIQNGKLRLEAFEKPRGLRRPIDKFLESLAADAGARAVAIILSGTGSDGSTGVRAIKESGGLVFVQDPKQADYDGMPRSAIETGAEDLVLPTEEMISVVMEYFSIRTDLEPAAISDSEFIERVAKHVRFRTGHDFASYKQATLLRRLAVRMSVLGLTSPQDYLKVLINNKNEAAKLFRDLLINVTSFFRDPEAFETLRDKVITPLASERGKNDEIRIWVPGCSTGQEAFTIAMLLAEELDRLDNAPKVSIFATDIDDEALRMARKGQYPNSIIDEVPQHYLETYFTTSPGGYEVGPRLRDMVRFSNQSIIKDPPFSRIDLVSCRNVTIYFDSELQDFTMTVIHYALKEGGVLFLGPSETPRKIDELFSPLETRTRLYRRRPGPARRLDLPRMPVVQTPASRDALGLHGSGLGNEAFTELLLEEYAPAFLVLNDKDQLIYTSARAARYLQIKPGSVRMELPQLIAPELEPTLRRLLLNRDTSDTRRDWEYRGTLKDDEVRLVLSVEHVDGGKWLIVIEDRLDLVSDRPVTLQSDERVSTDYVRELESELDSARETIRTTVEELETSNEELKSSNEEMMSMNEELQSANEELSTTNEELQGKLGELRRANDDMANLIRSTRIVTIFLDAELKLRFFTPEARRVFRFVESDHGRRIDDIGSDIDADRFVALCESVLTSGKSVEQEIQTIDRERRFMLRIEPYAGDEKSVGGVVVVMTDVSVLRQAVDAAETLRVEAQARLDEIEQLYDVSPQAMALLSPKGTYLRVNRRMAEINGETVEAHEGQRLQDMIPDMIAAVDEPFRRVIEDGAAVVDLRIEGETPAHPGERRLFVTDWYPVCNESKDVVAVGVNWRDVTEATEMSMELRRVMQELQHRVKNMLSNVLALISRARRDATSDYEVIDTLAARIRALSNTHKLLTEENWRAADIYSLLRPELNAVYGDDRVEIQGPALKLNARASVSLGMAIHELATNAAKYGAFSNNRGKVHLSWVRLDDGTSDRIVFTWQEKDGPEVSPQDRNGFGSQLIHSTVNGSLDGTVDMEWNLDGLKCTIEIPYRELSELSHDVIYDSL